MHRRDTRAAMRKAGLLSTTALMGAMALGASGPAAAQEAGEEVEEIVVTGSYIRRTSFDSSSPLAILNAEDISREGKTQFAEVFSQMTFNTGSDFSSTAFTNGAGEGTGNINLRGLGPAATLVLLNGRRQVTFASINDDNVQFVDVNSMIPEIAVDRIETIKDGAAALYGADAIAGVVNFITRHNFEGAELDIEYRTTTEDPDNQIEIQGIFGGFIGNRTHMMSAFRFRDTQGILTKERPELFRPLQFLDAPRLTLQATDPAVVMGLGSAGQPFGTPEARNVSLSSLGSPGFFTVPLRDADGKLLNPATRGSSTIGSSALPIQDPLCGAEGVGGLPAALGPDIPGVGQVGQCFFAFSGDFNLEDPLTRWQAYTEVTHQIANWLEFQGTASWNQVRTLGLTSASFPPLPPGQPIPGENPGNTFLARDALGNPVLGVTDQNGNPLFGAIDEAGNPIIDADLGSPLFGGRVLVPSAVNDTGQIVGTRLVVGPNGDIDAASLPTGFTADQFNEVVGLFGTVPRGNDGVELGGANARPSRDETTVYRFSGVFAGEIPFLPNWTFETGVVVAGNTISDINGADTIRDNFDLAIVGKGGGQGNLFFNPFGSAAIASPGDPQFNTEEAEQFIELQSQSNTRSRLTTVDVHVTGDLPDVPFFQPYLAGQVAVAAGFQFRRERLDQASDDNLLDANTVFIGGTPAFDVEREAKAVFGEVAIPIHRMFELDVAVRFENFDKDFNDESVDPKVSGLFTPFDSLSIRGSWGTAFKVPDLFQIGGKRIQVEQLDDTGPGQSGLTTFFGIELTGNEELESQQSENWGVGFTWQPTNEFGGFFEGLTVEFDYWNFEFEDVIGVANAQAELDRDPFGPGVIRSPDGDLIRVLLPFRNAPSLETDGVDFAVNYRWDTAEFGFFNIGANTTWVNSYEVAEFAGDPAIDRVGLRNLNFEFAAPIPEFRINALLGWNYENHSFSTIIRFIDSLRDDDNLQPSGEFAKIDSHTQIDLQYTYTMPWEALGFSDPLPTRLTFGVLNVANNKVPLVHNTDGGVDGRQGVDPRDRMVYISINQSL